MPSKSAVGKGITVRGYHADNGVFKASEWVMDCRSKHQDLIFAGVNARHTNGRAERRIRLSIYDPMPFEWLMIQLTTSPSCRTNIKRKQRVSCSTIM